MKPKTDRAFYDFGLLWAKHFVCMDFFSSVMIYILNLLATAAFSIFSWPQTEFRWLICLARALDSQYFCHDAHAQFICFALKNTKALPCAVKVVSCEANCRLWGPKSIFSSRLNLGKMTDGMKKYPWKDSRKYTCPLNTDAKLHYIFTKHQYSNIKGNCVGEKSFHASETMRWTAIATWPVAFTQDAVIHCTLDVFSSAVAQQRQAWSIWSSFYCSASQVSASAALGWFDTSRRRGRAAPRRGEGKGGFFLHILVFLVLI